MSQRIEFIDKQQGKDLPDVPIEKKLTFEDANEIKAVVNAHADELEALPSTQTIVEEVLNTDTIKDIEAKTPWVTPEMFGAVGDGETDDKLAIQTALDMGGIVFFGENKVYKSVGSLTLIDNNKLNLNGSTIAFETTGDQKNFYVSGSNCEIKNGTIVNEGTGTITGGDYQSPLVIGNFTNPDIVVKGFRASSLVIVNNNIDCNGISILGNVRECKLDNIHFPSSATIGCGILSHWGFREGSATEIYHPTNIEISNIRMGNMINSTYAGIGFQGVSSSGSINFKLSNLDIEETRGIGVFLYCGDWGYNYAADPLIHDISPNHTVDNVTIKNTTKRGISVKGVAGTSLELQIMTVELNAISIVGDANAAIQDGIYLENCSNVHINAAYSTKCRSGLLLGGITKNISISNSTLISNRLSGINFSNSTAGSSECIVSKCLIKNNGTNGTASQASGIRLDYNDNISVDNCVFEDESNTQLYGVFFTANTKSLKLSNNYVKSLATGGNAYYTNDNTAPYIGQLKEFYNNQASVGINVLSAATFCPVHVRSTQSGILRIFDGPIRPTNGTWNRGDIIYSSLPGNGFAFGWVCTTAGTPGTWRPISTLTLKAATGSRPSFGTDDYGVSFMDTTLSALGKMIWWNGTAWVDAGGLSENGIANKIQATATIDFGSVPANSELAAPSTVTVTGAAVGDAVLIGAPNTAGIVYKGVVTSTNTVTLYACNFTTSAVDPPQNSFKITVIK